MSDYYENLRYAEDAIDRHIENMKRQLTPSEAYDRYVGGITVNEFLMPFGGNVDMAVDQLMEEAWWVAEREGSHPDDLPELIREYIESKFIGD